MRPQKLSLKNFMPFRSTGGEVQEVDFSNMDLFAITGPMASGKSSLIDAMVWCLYGRTARYGGDSKGVICTGESICEVAFDFTIGPRWFRAVRRTGKTTDSGLSERENDEWIQDISGSDRLTTRIEELLGLDFDSFTKTVILPQGKYAQFLSSEPSKRRELLEKILALSVYKRVAERAKDLDTRAKTRAETIHETLQQPQYAGVTLELIVQRREELDTLKGELAVANAREEVLRSLAQHADTVSRVRTRLVELQAEERVRAEESLSVQQKQEAAAAQLQSLAQALAAAVAEREELGYDARRHEIVQRVVTHLRHYNAAAQEMESKTQELHDTQQDLDRLSREIVEQERSVAEARRVYQESDSTLQNHIAAAGDIATLTTKLNQVQRWKEFGQESNKCTRQQQELSEGLVATRKLLAELAEQKQTKEREREDLQQQYERARVEEQDKRQQETDANRIGKELQDAAREEKRVAQEVEQAHAAVTTAEHQVEQHRQAVIQAEHQEQDAVRAWEEDRRRNEIAHLRAELHVGEPCPVCLVPVSEALTQVAETHGDYAAGQHAVAHARAALSQARQALQKIETLVATARARKESTERELESCAQKRGAAQEHFVARFPGHASLSAALAALQGQRQEIAALLSDLEGKKQAADQEKRELDKQHETLQRTEARDGEALRHAVARLETVAAQQATLATALAAYRVEGKDPETELNALRQKLLSAEKNVKTLESAARQAEESLVGLNTRKIKVEGVRGVIQSEHKAAQARAEQAARAIRENLDLNADAPLPSLAAVESELAAFVGKQEQQRTLLTREESLRTERAQCERQAIELGATLRTREEMLKNTRQDIVQAEQTLAQEQERLHAAIENSGMSELGPDSGSIAAQLTAAQERGITLRDRRSRLETEMDEITRRCTEKEQEETKLREAQTESRLAADLRKLLGAEFIDYLSEGAIKALMHDASLHLQKLTHGRYSFRIESKRRTIDLLIVDHEDQQRTRPTHSLSGGETFLASLAIALALSQSFREIATGKAATTSTECLILDEGFGTLDREGLQLVTETLQELRGEEGRMVGIITHVEEVAAAMPTRIEVNKGNRTSTVTVSG